VTALFGAAAIGATTVAVERVVLEHLRNQLEDLKDNDSTAFATIAAIVDDERRHHDHGLTLTGGSTRWRHVLMPIVSASTHAVIWLGLHL
jgi:ubiquinone biosynthesis monooxygenase Coq7